MESSFQNLSINESNTPPIKPPKDSPVRAFSLNLMDRFPAVKTQVLATSTPATQEKEPLLKRAKFQFDQIQNVSRIQSDSNAEESPSTNLLNDAILGSGLGKSAAKKTWRDFAPTCELENFRPKGIGRSLLLEGLKDSPVVEKNDSKNVPSVKDNKHSGLVTDKVDDSMSDKGPVAKFDAPVPTLKSFLPVQDDSTSNTPVTQKTASDSSVPKVKFSAPIPTAESFLSGAVTKPQDKMPNFPMSQTAKNFAASFASDHGRDEDSAARENKGLTERKLVEISSDHRSDHERDEVSATRENKGLTERKLVEISSDRRSDHERDEVSATRENKGLTERKLSEISSNQRSDNERDEVSAARENEGLTERKLIEISSSRRKSGGSSKSEDSIERKNSSSSSRTKGSTGSSFNLEEEVRRELEKSWPSDKSTQTSKSDNLTENEQGEKRGCWIPKLQRYDSDEYCDYEDEEYDEAVVKERAG